MRNRSARATLCAIVVCTVLLGPTPTFGSNPPADGVQGQRPGDPQKPESSEPRDQSGEPTGQSPAGRDDEPRLLTSLSRLTSQAPRPLAEPGVIAARPWARGPSQPSTPHAKSSGGFGAWWKSESKTTRAWAIVGAVLVVGISAAALSD